MAEKRSKRDGQISRYNKIKSENSPINDDKKEYKFKLGEFTENEEVMIDTLLNKYDIFNPIFNIREINYQNKSFTLIDDSNLLGGTKQRAISPYLEMTSMKYSGHKELVLVASSQGFAQVAAAIGSAATKIPITVYTNMNFKDGNQVEDETTTYAKSLNPNMKVVIVKGKERPALLKEIKYHASLSVRNGGYALPFGLKDEERLFQHILAKAIKRTLPENFINEVKRQRRIWLVVGSGLILHTLYEVFPNALFGAVKVGKEIDWIIDENNTTLYNAKEGFCQPVSIVPPYNSVLKYDAKIWPIITKFGADGDIIWNVAGEIPASC